MPSNFQQNFTTVSLTTSFPGSLFSAFIVDNDNGGREQRPWERGCFVEWQVPLIFPVFWFGNLVLIIISNIWEACFIRLLVSCLFRQVSSHLDLNL